MSGSPFVSSTDQKVHVQTDWHDPASGAVSAVDFIVDTGASRSTVDRPTSIGLTIKAHINVTQASGRGGAAVLSGTCLEVEARDTASGSSAKVRFSGDVLLMSVNLLGVDFLNAAGLGFRYDARTRPPTVAFEC